MPRITVISEFDFSENGLEVITFQPGEHEVSDLCARYAEKYGHIVVAAADPEPAQGQEKTDENEETESPEAEAIQKGKKGKK